MKLANAKPPIANRRIVGIQKAADYAGVSRWMLRGWILTGRLPAIRYPGKHGMNLKGSKVDLDDLDRFIESVKEKEVDKKKK